MTANDNFPHAAPAPHALVQAAYARRKGDSYREQVLALTRGSHFAPPTKSASPQRPDAAPLLPPLLHA